MENKMKKTLTILLAALCAGACNGNTGKVMTTKAPRPYNVTTEDMDYLRKLMKETWHYIDFYVSPVTGMPYDSNKSCEKTNTTNIGLYLTSLCMAYKLGYVTEDYAVARIKRILDSLDTYGNWKRLYNNWLDPNGKQRKAKPGRNNISDYNKLPAGIIVVRSTFPQFKKRCTTFLDEIPWEVFHDAKTDQVFYEFDVVAQKTLTPIHLHRGDDKILGHFLMIASGKVPPSTWEKHDLSMEKKHGYSYYKHGWQGGGLFMQFICGMFLDNRGTSLGRSGVNFTWAQILHGRKQNLPVWGWSSCFAPDGKYMGWDCIVDRLVTPHASALAIHLFPRDVIDNLQRLEKYGLREPFVVNGKAERFGFRDGVDLDTRKISEIYLVLDQAMLFLSLVNYCEDGLLWKTFDKDPLVRRGKHLIKEYRDAPGHRQAERDYIVNLARKPSALNAEPH